MSRGRNLTPEAIEIVRRMFPALIRRMTATDAARIIASTLDGLHYKTIWECAMNRTYHDKSYKPPCLKYKCARCGYSRPTFRYFYVPGDDRQAMCESCSKSSATEKRYRSRDGYEREKYRCPTCLMGAGQDGKAFTSQDEANKCCEGVKPACKVESQQPSRGKYDPHHRFPGWSRV